MKAKRVAIGAVVALVLGVLGGAVLERNQDGRAWEVNPPLAVSQASSATDQGIRVSVLSASFSGTSTYVQVRYDWSASPEADAGIVSMGVAPESTIAPSFLGGLIASEPRGEAPEAAVLRLGRATSSGHHLLNINAIDLRTRTRGTVRIAGQWSLDIDDRGQTTALRSEELQAVPNAAPGAVAVRVLSAVRSSSETLVTVELTSASGEAIGLLVGPTMDVAGRRLDGAVVSSGEGGRVQNLRFPATPFGEKVTPNLGPFALAGSDRSSFTDIDMASAMGRQGLTGKRGESGLISADERTPSAQGPSPVRSFAFDNIHRRAEDVNTLTFVLEGNFEQTSGDFMAVIATGETVHPLVSESSYTKDSTGAVFAGTTRVSFPLGDARDWKGTVRIFHGSGNELIHDVVRVELQPR